MAPDRVGTLAVLNLSFQGKVLVSNTQLVFAGTEENPDPTDKLYVSWNELTKPEGYLSVAEGAAYVREASISRRLQREEELMKTEDGSYIWGNTVRTSWMLLIVMLPIARRLEYFTPEPQRMRAKVFNERLVLIIWADAPKDKFFEATLRIAPLQPNRDLELEAERINNSVHKNIPVFRDVVVPEFGCDLCVVTALPEPEFTALKEVPWNWQRERENPEDPYTDYWGGFYTAGNRKRKVIAACSPRMGMPAAAILAAKMIHLFAPRYLAMVGILAGIRNKCSLGDVIAVDPSWDWGNGKWSEKDGIVAFEAAPHQIELDRSMRSKLDRMRLDEDGVLDGIRRGWERRTGKKVGFALNMHIGPVASGAAVLADNHKTDLIKDQHRKVVGVEMEAYAIFVAAREARVLPPNVIVFKSVADFADTEKRDDHQGYAAYTSAQALKHFAETYLTE
jgi:nucleoside phosphorylase